MLAAISIAVLLAQSPIQHASSTPQAATVNVAKAAKAAVGHVASRAEHSRTYAVDLHPMTPEEQAMYPGRERFDKTEWYESQFKSAKVVPVPEHVDAWHNGGLDLS